MKITCDKHILHNVYEYDFKSSSYNILKNVMYDVSDIPFENKECRNMQHRGFCYCRFSFVRISR